MITQNMKAEDLERFEEEIGMKSDPIQVAKDALKAHQEAMGMAFDNPDAPVAPDAKAIALMNEAEITEAYMGDGKHGR